MRCGTTEVSQSMIVPLMAGLSKDWVQGAKEYAKTLMQG